MAALYSPCPASDTAGSWSVTEADFHVELVSIKPLVKITYVTVFSCKAEVCTHSLGCMTATSSDYRLID